MIRDREEWVFNEFKKVAKDQLDLLNCENGDDPPDFICSEKPTRKKIGFELKELAFEQQMKKKDEAKRKREDVWGGHREAPSELTNIARKQIEKAEQKVFNGGKIKYPVDLLLCMNIDFSLGFNQDWESAKEGINKSLEDSIGQKFRKIWLFSCCDKKLEKWEMSQFPPPVGQASRLSEHSWRRHLPHYQQSAGYYFITFTTYKRQLLSPPHKDCVFSAIGFLDDKKYELYAAVVLNDHVHLVINPIEALSKIMHSIKSFTAHEINKIKNSKGKIWQDENLDRVIRNEKEFLEKINYIANNPIKAGLAEKYEDYKWLFIKGWINDN